MPLRQLIVPPACAAFSVVLPLIRAKPPPATCETFKIVVLFAAPMFSVPSLKMSFSPDESELLLNVYVPPEKRTVLFARL